MQGNGFNHRASDRLLKMPGKLDRGPVEFQSRVAPHAGEIMGVATTRVVAVPPTMSIIGAAQTMTTCGFRRLPVTDPGTQRMRGIITASDIINLLGGGDKQNLVTVKHGGNLLAAINEPVREIMSGHYLSIRSTGTIAEAVEIILGKKVGGIPVIDEEETLVGIVTERDVLRLLETQPSPLTVEEVMSTQLRVTAPDATVGAATREMGRCRFRRLPVVSDDVLFGIITSTDIVRYLGSGEVFEGLVIGEMGELMALPVRTLMRGELITTTPETPIDDAARLMHERRIGALPVIEDSRLIGLVTEFDLVRAYAEGKG
ncbi:MAG TPA: CBS domain-containing protein [Methanoregulaceae archaeon]|nr:CBS domain-containing protein [Methanoregulaceae archaeon]HQJ88562.1 CBS domain-containing protein [Methanoregulaceae archaeon]